MTEEAPARRQVRRHFRASTPRLSPDEMRRQGEIAKLAWEHLGERDAVIAFMNTHDPVLEARPIDLAVESDAGLARAGAALTAMPRP